MVKDGLCCAVSKDGWVTASDHRACYGLIFCHQRQESASGFSRAPAQFGCLAVHIFSGRGISHRTIREYYRRGGETIRPKVAGDLGSNPNEDLDDIHP